MRPPRPLLWLALALVAGTLAARAGPLPARATLGLVALALIAALVARPWRHRRARLPPEASWASLVLFLAWARAAGAEAPGRGAAGDPGAHVGGARELPLVGVLGPRGSLAAVEGDRPGPGQRLILLPQGPAPPAGSSVAVLPGSEVRAWSRGPVPAAPGGRASLGLTRVLPEELVILGEPSVGGAPGQVRSALGRAATELRAAARRRLLGPPGTAPSSARRWWAALVLGERALLSGEEVDALTRTGTIHVLSVSGLHVVLVGALLLGLRRLLGRRASGRAGGLLVGGGLVVYAVLAGAEPPVVRATVAGTLALARPRGGPEEGGWPRTADPLSLWALALALEGLAAPSGLGDLGLQLSYAATLALLLGTRPLAARLAAPFAPRAAPLLETPWTALWRGLRQRALRGTTTSLAASAVAFLATLPLVAAAFGELAPAGILLTPLLVPGLFLGVGTGLAALVLPTGGLAALFQAGLWTLELPVELADRLPGTPLPWAPRPFPALALAATATVALAAGVRRGARAVAAAWAVLLLPWSAAPAGLEVHALDVGHGTAVAVRGPGLPALVFDAGSRDRPGTFEEALGPLLASWEVRAVDIVLSHHHRDHASALGRVARRYRVRSWAGAGSAQAGVRCAHVPPALDLEEGRVRLPLPRTPVEATLVRGSPEAGNEGSRMLELRLGEARVILAGDAEGEGLRKALEAGWVRGPARLLLFPHHGSDSPWTGRLLELARPGEVWISAAGPAAVEGELARRGIPCRSTARHGPLASLLRSQSLPRRPGRAPGSRRPGRKGWGGRG